METNGPPSRDQQQSGFLTHTRQRINALIPEEFDELREAAFDYATVMMVDMQLPDTSGSLRANAEHRSASFLAPFHEEGQIALGIRVLKELNATLAQYGNFKQPGVGR